MKYREKVILVAIVSIVAISIGIVWVVSPRNQSVAGNTLNYKTIDAQSLPYNAMVIEVKNLTDFSECVRLFQGSDATVFRAPYSRGTYIANGHSSDEGIVYFFPYQGCIIATYVPYESNS